MPLRKFFLLFFLLLLVLLVQEKFKADFAWTPDFVLATLLTVSFFADFLTLIFLSLFSIWVLNWQPALSPEAFLLFFLPLSVWGARIFFPYRPWLNNLISISLGSVVFYFFASQFLFLSNFFVFLFVLSGSLLSGSVVFFILDNFYKV